jgi:hypothetical protein
MVFRRIYWVVEEFKGNESTVAGVFTSIIDLREFLSPERMNSVSKTRLNLMKLDAPDGTLGKWDSTDFSSMRGDLDQFVKTGEFTIDQCDDLVDTLGALAK